MKTRRRQIEELRKEVVELRERIDVVAQALHEAQEPKLRTLGGQEFRVSSLTRTTPGGPNDRR